MCKLILFAIFACFGQGIATKDTYNYTINHFDVLLDHFNYVSNTTFKIRYLTNKEFVVKTKYPIFFYTGNEGDIELFAQNTGFMWEAAKEMGAMVVFAEHRYYGQSLPFENKSYDSPAHLGYLTSEQALADFADLLQLINPGPDKLPVIAFGGSYGGMLAAWFRMKYPYLVAGAIAASAPILQFEQIEHCDVFSRIITSVFATSYTKPCATNIRNTWKMLRDTVSTADGRKTLNSKFKFCSELSKPEDIEIFFDYLNDVYGNLAMANYPYEANFLAPLPAYPVREFCGRLKTETNGTELLEDFWSALSIYSNYTGKTSCLNISSAYDVSMGDRGWDFQACTEMVMPMCSTGVTDMFPPQKWDYQQYSDKCYKKFGIRPRAKAAITYYGGNNLKDASNIVFSNGLLDPWSGGGVLRSSNDNIYIIIIPEGAHHIDLRASNSKDPHSVIEARRREKSIMQKWIEAYWK